MKYIKSIYESLNQLPLEVIVNYISKKSNIELYPYGGTIIVERDRKKYNSFLYLTTFGKAIRFNFDKDVLSSIDIWKEYTFNSKKPDYTMEIYTQSITNILGDIYLFFQEKNIINEEFDNIDKDEYYEVHKAFDEKIDFLVGKSQYKISSFNMATAKAEHVKRYSATNTRLDIFEAIKYSTLQVAHNVSHFLLILGDGGFGKTTTVKETLNDAHKKYTIIKGSITEAALYEMLFKKRDKNDLVILDDCDSWFDNANMLNIIKAATETDSDRLISKFAKTYFDSSDMSDEEIENEYIKTRKLPNSFSFNASIICITNISEGEFEKNKNTRPLLTRGLRINVGLNKLQALNKIKKVMNSMSKIDDNAKQEALDYLVFIVDNYKTKDTLNIRTYIHVLNTRLSNNFNTEINGEKMAVWKLLVNEYLIKR